MHLVNRVLILDAGFPSALAIIRSLGRRGIVCDIASNEKSPICSYSKYYSKHYQYPNPLSDTERFVDRIAEMLEIQEYDLVIPVTEQTLIPLSESNKLDRWRKILAIADPESLVRVLDKAKTFEIAKDCNIPFPLSYNIKNISDIDRLPGNLRYPVVLKPGRSIPNAETRHQLNVIYVFNDEELLAGCQYLLRFCSVILQEYIQGIGTGIELLADHGEIVYSFQHQRLHEIPLTGGGSCYRKSILVNPTLYEASQKLIKALDWHGVAMVEFKFMPETGEYWLMEINGRFWGSLPLATAAGADFPFMLYDLLVHHKKPVVQTYRENVCCRKLSTDIYWYEQVFRREENPQLVNYPSTKQLVKDLVFVLHPTRHAFDVQSWRDPLPGMVDVYRIFADYKQRLTKLLKLKWLAIWSRSPMHKKRLRNCLKQAQSILFLCYGNINRSALAQVLAENLYLNSRIHMASAGFHPVSGRPVDPNMMRVAAQQGLDLSNHLSKTVTPTLLQEADVIFVMVREQYLYMKQTYPEFRAKIFLLGSLNDQINLDIDDPFEKPFHVYENCFNDIKKAVESLALS